MPFGFSNAPATFQALMNDVLQSFLRRFVLVFFYDILIYSSSWSEHLQHVRLVFDALRAHNLHLKHSKCSFGSSSVAYLGHVISAEGVAMDSAKVEAVASWPEPRSARGVRGFLGLAGYYRKFIRDFGAIAAPRTRLLRKEAFAWTAEAAEAFAALKQALCTGPVLQMPDFERQFVVDCDASSTGFGAVLHQGPDPWPSTAGRSPPATSSWRPTRGSSSAWYRLCGTGGPTSGGAASCSAQITTA